MVEQIRDEVVQILTFTKDHSDFFDPTYIEDGKWVAQLDEGDVWGLAVDLTKMDGWTDQIGEAQIAIVLNWVLEFVPELHIAAARTWDGLVGKRWNEEAFAKIINEIADEFIKDD